VSAITKFPAGLKCMPDELFIDDVDATMDPDVEPRDHFTILSFPVSRMNKLPYESSMIAVGLRN
jgi:hypothetical protein